MGVKILIVGLGRWPQYEAAFAAGLRAHSIEVDVMPLHPYFAGRLGRAQEALPVPLLALMLINQEVVRKARALKPTVVLFWRPTHILPTTLRTLRGLGIFTVSYNNDDPFGPAAHGKVPWHHHALWHWYLRDLPLFDLNLFYRRINCAEADALGSRRSQVMLPYFIPEQDHPVALSQEEQARFGTEVVFVGHHEPDGREACIRQLVESGITVRLWGGDSWSPQVLGDLYPQLAPVLPALGLDYAKALCGAQVCLCFLSKLNRDTYTRRCFEIPACGRVLLAERTADLKRFFVEDEEACFFDSADEMLAKVRWLLEQPQRRQAIAQAGLRRVWADGHSVAGRARQFLELLPTTCH